MTRKPLNRDKLGINKALGSSPAARPVPAEADKDWVNMNFKAEREHRRHWKTEAAKRSEDLSSVIRAYLADRYGLPNRGEGN